MSSLKLSKLNKVYPSGETALYDVNLEADDKEFLVIVGGEKCGKSSLLRIIAGLEEATGGAVMIDGKDVTDLEPKERDIAMMFGGNTLYPALNVYDNMAFGLKIRKVAPALIDARVRVIAGVLGLTDNLFRKPKALSAAVKQRVALGRVLVREPQIYLFDDPLAGLDEKLRADLLNVIVNMQARVNGTFVYATKNLSEALTIGTRLVILKNGFVQQIDTPENLYDYPANAYVAFFIGSPTVNFLKECTITVEESTYFVNFGEYRLALDEEIVSRFENIAEYAGTDKKVLLGIRPEDIKTASEGLAATIVKKEKLGDAFYAECSLNGHNLVATVEEGSEGEVKLAVDGKRLLIFDSVTRLTLLKKDDGYVKNGHADAEFVPLPYDEEQRIIGELKPKKEQKKKK